LIQISYQLHAPSALTLDKETWYPIIQEARWTPEAVSLL